LGLIGEDGNARLLFIAVVLMDFGLWLLYGDRDFSTKAQTGSGSPVATILWSICYLIGVAGILHDRKRAGELLKRCLPLILFVAYVIASAIWADEPFIAGRRAFEFLGSCSLAFFIAMRLGIHEYVRTLATAISISSILSILLIIFVPSIGFEINAFAGFFANKNGLGPAMVIGMITIVCAMEHSRGKMRTLKFSLLTLFLVLLMGSLNGSGLITAIVIGIMAVALVRSRETRSPKLVLICAAILAVVGFFSWLSGFGIDDILGLFGKDSTLTGRTDLWQAVGEAMQDRPIFGYGYASFWGLDGPAARLVYPVIAWTPESSHNGFIEVQLGMGIIGEALLMLFLAVGLSRSWRMFWGGTDFLSAWPLLTTLYVILSNLAGATFTSVGNSVDCAVLIASFIFATQATATICSKRSARKIGKSVVTRRIGISTSLVNPSIRPGV
jgi:O-antigen ligase